MKKILIVATVYHFLNFEKNDIQMLENLGYEVHTATNMKAEKWLQDDGTLDDICIINHQVDFSRSPFTLKSLKAYRELKKVMKSYQFDIVHCHTPVAAAITRIAAFRVRGKKPYIIYTCHGFHFNKKSGLKDWIFYYPLERILAHFTNMIITINKEDYGVVSKFKVKEKRYIPGVGVDVEGIKNISVNKIALRRKMGIPTNAFVIMSIGELSARKNQQVILRAIAKLRDKNIIYVMCGTGKKKGEYENLAIELGIKDQVIFTGQENHDWVMKFSHCIDLGAIPSKIEGLGLAGIEMLAAEKPLVGSNVHGIKDYLVDGKTGISCDPEDIEGFSKAIFKLKNDKEFYDTCVKNTYAMAKKFDKKISQKLMLDNYKTVELQLRENL